MRSLVISGEHSFHKTVKPTIVELITIGTLRDEKRISLVDRLELLGIVFQTKI
jgi:hypothetical protein